MLFQFDWESLICACKLQNTIHFNEHFINIAPIGEVAHVHFINIAPIGLSKIVYCFNTPVTPFNTYHQC